MQGVLIISIIFGGIVLALSVIGITLLMGIKLLKGGVSREQQRNNAREARMIQEIHRGLARLEARIEALETIVLDHRKDASPDETN
jgi:phage shock protein B